MPVESGMTTTSRCARRFLVRSAAVLAFCLASVVPPAAAQDSSIAPTIEAALAEKGFDVEVLSVIGNVLRHEPTWRPPSVDALVQGSLDAPGAIADGIETIETMIRDRIGLGRDGWRATSAGNERTCPIKDRRLPAILDWYIERLAEDALGLTAARHTCAARGCPSVATFVAATKDDAVLRKVLATPAVTEGAQHLRDDAPGLFALHQELLACLGAVPRDTAACVRLSAWGAIAFGTTGDDVYKAGTAAVIIDPGGNDRYDLAPVPPGRLRVIIDLAGDDSYVGSDPAFLAAAILIDRAGNDSYDSPASGQAATIAGLSLLVDGDGDDAYSAVHLAQGAAVSGMAVLVDGAGVDRYRVATYGQGYGGPLGVGVLWDTAGNDTYDGVGLVDTKDGRGRLSWTQGVGRGLRLGVGGGIGLLLDDAGDDRYAAELFAQGSGYYFGLGMVRDGAGDDQYRARRYAQGAGVHQAVGILDDKSGNDTYETSIGVSQGLGLDTAVGVLRDRQGDDTYSAKTLAQGAGTARGIGILVEGGGRDRFAIDGSGWGQDHWSRGLPGPSFLLGADTADTFVLGKEEQTVEAMPVAGPHGTRPPRAPGPRFLACPDVSAAAGAAGALVPLVNPLAALRGSAPRAGKGDAEMAIYRSLTAGLPDALPGYLAAVPSTEFADAFALLEIVRCWVATASEQDAMTLARLLTEDLVATSPHPRPWLNAHLLERLPGTVGSRRPAIEALVAHPSCAARSRALDLARTGLGPSAPPPAWSRRLVSDALSGDCWHRHAAVLRLLETRPDLAGSMQSLPPTVPAFLRRPRPLFE